MSPSKESAAFAELLAESFPTAEGRAAHEREVAKLVAFAGSGHGWTARVARLVVKLV